MRREHIRNQRMHLWLLVGLGVVGVLALGLWMIQSHQQAPTESPAGQPPRRAPAQTPLADDGPTIQFTDVTAAAGITFTHEAGATGDKWYPETMGSGVGFFDYDADGWPDILLVNGTRWPQTRGEDVASPEPSMRLYRNRGDGTFEDVTVSAGVDVPLYGMGLAVADYDNDGDADVLLTGYLRNLFLINNGQGRFTDATRRVGIQAGKWGSGAAFFDYDRDGYVDLVIGNYVEWTPEMERGLDCTYGTPAKDYCPVRYFKGQGLTLYHNQGDGTFEDVTKRAGVASEGSRVLATAVLDINDDLWPDLFIANDGTPSLLYRNRGDGTFEDMSLRSGVVLDEGGTAYAGMGIDSTYPRNDGQLCIAIGNFVGEPTTLHCQVRQGESYHPELYADVSAWAGIGRATLPFVTFGLFFFDADLDGFEDLFMVNGHVVDEARLRNAPQAQRPQLFRNLGTGKFQEVLGSPGSGLGQALVGRGAAYADYDGDGDLDILLSQNQGPAVLLRNDTRRRTHYLRVRLTGRQSNRDGIGTEVRVHSGGRTLRQMLRSGRSYYSQNEMPLTFGLGHLTSADRVEIAWPSGVVDVYQDIAADTTLEALEGSQSGQLHAKVRRPSPVPTPSGVAQSVEAPPTASISTEYLAQTHAGISAYKVGRYAEATQAFEAAKALQPTASLPYRYLVDLYWQQGKPPQAAQAVRALGEVMPDAYFLDRLGGDYEASGMPGLARLLFGEAVRLDPAFPSARYNLGRIYLKQGQLEDGIGEIQEALRLYPDFAEAHETLGKAYSEQGRFDAAIAELQRGLVLNPALAGARNHLGRIYMAQGRLDEAIRTFQELVKQSPEVAEARHNLAVAYARKGIQERAIEQFKAALRLQPAFHEARMDLATVWLEMRQPDRAIEALQTVISTASGHIDTGSSVDVHEVRYRLGIAYLMAGQVDKALGAWQAVLTEQPQHAGAHVQLGRVYYQMRQFEPAWRHARLAEALGAPVAELIAALSRVSAEP